MTATILFGASNGYRILPIIHLWTLLATLNLTYALAATSWLLYYAFTAFCYPTIVLTCILQFEFAAGLVRRLLRRLVTELSFVKDTVALFNVPGLAIDVDVIGLMAIRGLTLQLSSLTVIAYDIEVGIKITDDLEISIVTDRCEVRLFRGVTVGDCYANVKAGGEMSLDVKLDHEPSPHTGQIDSSSAANEVLQPIREMKSLSAEDSHADEFRTMLENIKKTGVVERCRLSVLETVAKREKEHDGELIHVNKAKELRAAICSRMQVEQTVPHPPSQSIKVSTLQHMLPPRIDELLCRSPLLLRLLLNPIAYLHPVKISSISAAGSGQHIVKMLDQHLFKGYDKDDRELHKIHKRIMGWLSEANFVLELVDISGVASVPLITSYDIIAMLQVGDIIASRILDQKEDIEQVCRFGGGDASFQIPSYLLPHHEHLLPPKATREEEDRLQKSVDAAEDKLDKVLAERSLEEAEKDETNVKMSAHVSLPVAFSQDVLDFIAALVKASKIVEIEQEIHDEKEHHHGIQAFGRGVKETIKKTTVESIVNDSWIAKMVGKVTKKLEESKGDVGYSGTIPVQLKKYRLPEGDVQNNKILP